MHRCYIPFSVGGKGLSSSSLTWRQHEDQDDAAIHEKKRAEGGTADGRGSSEQARFNFTTGHPLHKMHEQQLNRKIPTMQLVGPSPPKAPRHHRRSPECRRGARQNGARSDEGSRGGEEYASGPAVELPSAEFARGRVVANCQLRGGTGTRAARGLCTRPGTGRAGFGPPTF